jgi:microcystin-dependent protein
MPIAKNNKMILYGGIGLAVLVVIIIAFMMMKKEKYVGAAAFGTAPLQNGGLMLESDANGNLSTSATLPIGSIIMWSGLLQTIPIGWALCDGDNNTPDMTSGLFPRGVGSDEDLGKTGGADTVSLFPENVPLVTPCTLGGCAYNYSTTVITGKGGPVDFSDNAYPSNTMVPAANASKQQPITSYSTNSYYANGTLTEGAPIAFNIQPKYRSVYFIMKMM